MKRNKNSRLVALQRQQIQLKKVEKEIRKMISNVNESLNALKVEELQLKSYAISCCVGPDGQKVAPMVFSHQWDRSDKESPSSNVSTLPASSSTFGWLDMDVSIGATHNPKSKLETLPSYASENDINKQKINLETSFRSSFSFLNKSDEEEEEDDDNEEQEPNEDY